MKKPKTKKQIQKEIMKRVDIFTNNVHLEAQRFMNKVFEIVWEEENDKKNN